MTPRIPNRPDVPVRRRARCATSVLVSVTFLAGCTAVASSSDVPASATSPTLSWVPCPGAGGDQCASVEVPVDYRHPGHGVLSIEVIRHLATDPSAKKGVLIFNPGGPGESGVQIFPLFVALVPPAVQQDFDLVSFDVRGTGQSGQLRCGPGPGAVAAVAPAPDRTGSPLPGTAVFTRLAGRCLADDPLTRTVGTVDTARDLDRIRQALGVDRLDYYGLSYGTELGAVYATMFGSHVGAMVLDGAVDPLQSLSVQATEEAPEIDAALSHFFTTCGADPTCPLRPDPKALYDGLLARLAKAPLPAPGGGDATPVTLGDLETATLLYLSVPRYTPAFPAAVAAAARGHGGPLAKVAASFEEDIDGAPLAAAQWAITCQDAPRHLGPVAAGTLAARLAARFPPLGAEAVSNDLAGCVAWPRGASPVTAVHGPPTPALVIGNTVDPNTPHVAAVQLARALGSARLVTWEGVGHTWLLNGTDDPCMQDLVTAYLVDGRVPSPGTTCP